MKYFDYLTEHFEKHGDLKAFVADDPALAPRWDLIPAMLLWAVHVASECWELLSLAMRGNSLAQESSSSGREQVVSLPEETDTANTVGRANPGVRSVKSTTPAFSDAYLQWAQ